MLKGLLAQKIFVLAIIIGAVAVTATGTAAYYYINYRSQSQEREELQAEYDQLVDDYTDLKSRYDVLTAKSESGETAPLGYMMSVTVIIDYGNGTSETHEVNISGGETAFDVTNEVATVDYTDYGWGILVHGINDKDEVILGQGGNWKKGYGWFYYVDGAQPLVGSDQYTLSDGEVLEWKYEYYDWTW